MHHSKPDSEQGVFVRPGHFPVELEREFQARYYADIAAALRLASFLLAALFLVYVGRDYYDTRSVSLAMRQNGAPTVFFLILYGLTFWNGFARCWQPVIMVGGWIASALALAGMAAFFGAGAAAGTAPSRTGGPFPGELLFYSLQTCILIVCLAVLRLQFGWALPLQVGVVCAAIWAFTTQMRGVVPDTLSGVSRVLQPTLLVLFAVLLSAFVQERLARSAFLASHLLEQKRNDERRKREQTEKTLQVLAQAIGGIVHDLGNPLTSVQMGAQTLQVFIAEGNTDKEILKEFTTAINDGAQMLNYLRLSLMEETRVLEGKPIPIERKPASLRQIVETGARYQKPNYASGRKVLIVGDMLELRVDAMKLTTVFMNLIGNALKYSDGEVRVTWRKDENKLLIAILDQGKGGQGVSETQARQLFVPFGRLDTHAQVEGTGLGLLSVRKIVEAHGGEVFIEGHADGTIDAPPFTTAQGDYASMLAEGFRTAFVVACPPN